MRDWSQAQASSPRHRPRGRGHGGPALYDAAAALRDRLALELLLDFTGMRNHSPGFLRPSALTELSRAFSRFCGEAGLLRNGMKESISRQTQYLADPIAKDLQFWVRKVRGLVIPGTTID